MYNIYKNIDLTVGQSDEGAILMQHFYNKRSDWLDVKSFRYTNLRYTVAKNDVMENPK